MQKLEPVEARKHLIDQMNKIYDGGSLSEKDILAKAFRNLSVQIHPDHFAESERPDATENFKVFAQAFLDLGAEIDRGVSLLHQQDSNSNNDIESAIGLYKGDPLNDPFDLDALREEFNNNNTGSNLEPEALENSPNTPRLR